MDPIAVLLSRIEQLEAKLGVGASDATDSYEQSATLHLLSVAQAVNNAAAGDEKLTEALKMAKELSVYTDPDLIGMIEQNDKRMQEVIAAEPVLRHHCQCMLRCKQTMPVLESEPLQRTPEMQAAVDRLLRAAAGAKADVDVVALGVRDAAAQCGAVAADACARLAAAARRLPAIEPAASTHNV